MCRFEGMPYREIAASLSATEAAVKSLIHRATRAVARRVETLEMGKEPERSPA
jgi:RNA polymerase sigma-70 factor (ECF subfamily)